MVQLHNDWDGLLAGEFRQPYYQRLRAFLKDEYAAGEVYPAMDNIFSALRLTAYQDVKVLLLGQDPYHGPGQAHGLAFSVQKGVAPPPSLVNMFKELRDDLAVEIPNSGCLEGWAKQGVLLLNTALTVRAGQPNSHKGKGWEIFTDGIVRRLNERAQGIVFLLWGANALSKQELITNPQHAVLTAPHPSPLSANRGFFGCKHFSKTNIILERMGQKPVAWEIFDS